MSAPLLVVLMLATVSSPTFAAVSEWVDFTSATTPPTTFALRRAQAQGIELKQELGTPLRGLLIRPEGQGLFPAIVLLHGCDGVQPFQEQWANDLARWGYVALLVDSHGPRGLGDDCAHYPPTTGTRTFDALGALQYLKGLPFIDASRVGAIRWDTGGGYVQRLLEAKGVQQMVSERFAAGVQLYPVGFPSGPVFAPVLILVGEKDDCFPATRIRHAMDAFDPGSIPIVLEALPGAARGFDNPKFTEPSHFASAQRPSCINWHEGKGTTLTYNKTAHEASIMRVRAFLDEHLK